MQLNVIKTRLSTLLDRIDTINRLIINVRGKEFGDGDAPVNQLSSSVRKVTNDYRG
jgi:hypothetical protein